MLKIYTPCAPACGRAQQWVRNADGGLARTPDRQGSLTAGRRARQGEHMDRKWVQAYLAPLMGGKIVAVTASLDGFPTLVVHIGKGKARVEYVLEISRDPEGNGPGFVFGLPAVQNGGAQ